MFDGLLMAMNEKSIYIAIFGNFREFLWFSMIFCNQNQFHSQINRKNKRKHSSKMIQIKRVEKKNKYFGLSPNQSKPKTSNCHSIPIDCSFIGCFVVPIIRCKHEACKQSAEKRRVLPSYKGGRNNFSSSQKVMCHCYKTIENKNGSEIIQRIS